MTNPRLGNYFAGFGMTRELDPKVYRTNEEWAEFGVGRFKRELLGFFYRPKVVSREGLVAFMSTGVIRDNPESQFTATPDEVIDQLLERNGAALFGREFLVLTPVKNYDREEMIRVR